MKYKAPRGVKDILPQDMHLWHFIEEKVIQLLEGNNFSEIRLPIFEQTALFIRGIGEDTDIVKKQMYTFKDKQGRDLCLRPEGTAGVIRAYIENNLGVRSKQTRLYYSGPMFRYERPQAGRMRQFYQIGAEIIGTDSPKADADIMIILMKLFDILKLKKYVTLHINSIGCKKCRKAFRAELQIYLRGKIDTLCEDCKNRLESNPLRCLDCKIDKDKYHDAPVIIDYLCEKCRDHFQEVKDCLDAIPIAYAVDPYLVRGLDYYTKTVFEIKCDGIGAQNTIAAGGRYDNLVKEMGGPDKPAIGFALGMERLVEVLIKSKNELAQLPIIYFAWLDEEARRKAMSYFYQLLPHKIYRVMTSYHEQGLTDHLKYANDINAEYVLILGENEVKEDCIIVKDMRNNSQEKIKLEKLEEYLKEHVKTKKDA